QRTVTLPQASTRPLPRSAPIIIARPRKSDLIFQPSAERGDTHTNALQKILVLVVGFQTNNRHLLALNITKRADVIAAFFDLPLPNDLLFGRREWDPSTRRITAL